MRIVADKFRYRFPFKKYINFILAAMPSNDMVGIAELRVVENFSHPKSDETALGSYFQGKNGKDAYIEIHIPNIVESHTPEYLFDLHFEIASLYLSEIIAHEIGHHVHKFKRHGIKKESYEEFADKYSSAGYHNYLFSRLHRILSSCTWGSRLYFIYDKKTRNGFKRSKEEILKQAETKNDKIPVRVHRV